MTQPPTLETLTQSKIHLIGGEKGGVGKSMVARLMAQYFIDHAMPFVGYDTDRSHGALLRYYAGYASPVLADRYEALDAIMESAADEPGRRVLVDLAAQTHAPLVKWMDESGVLDLADVSGMSIYYWHVMDSGRGWQERPVLCTSCARPAQEVSARSALQARPFCLPAGGPWLNRPRAAARRAGRSARPASGRSGR